MKRLKHVGEKFPPTGRGRKGEGGEEIQREGWTLRTHFGRAREGNKRNGEGRKGREGKEGRKERNRGERKRWENLCGQGSERSHRSSGVSAEGYLGTKKGATQHTPMKHAQ